MSILFECFNCFMREFHTSLGIPETDGYRKSRASGKPRDSANLRIPESTGFREPLDSGDDNFLRNCGFPESAGFRYHRTPLPQGSPYTTVPPYHGGGGRVENCCTSLFLFDSFSFCIACIRCVVLLNSFKLDCILEEKKKKSTTFFSVFFLR